MCGIFGYWDRGRIGMDDSVLKAMGRQIFHRGPDEEGIHHQPERGVGIGNQRLSIVDLEGGHQPFLSDDGMIAVVQNGEIFNYIELAEELRRNGVRLDSNSDTEILLRLYESEGIGFVKRLNGMFAIAIDDAHEDALYLVRDRIGVKPLYVADDSQRMVFGSEIKAMEPVGVLGRLDLEALHHYLTFNYVPPPWTIWQGVRHVMPGTWMRFDRAGVHTERWWSLAKQREQEYEFGEWAEEFLDILDDATRIRLRADVPWGAFLSGGVDSSTIVSMMARHANQPIKTFCIGFKDPRFDESAFALEAAKRFSCDHTMEMAEQNMLARWPQVLRHLDQPHGDASFMPTLRVSELAAQHVKVVLTGDGGDELFAGYDKYNAFFGRSDAFCMSDSDFQHAYFNSISLFTHEGKCHLYRPELAIRLKELNTFDAVAKTWFDESVHFDRINQALYLDMQLLLSGNNLVKPDRMGMAVSIEARTPFLDWRMMEFAFRSRGQIKLSSDGDKKHWYKKAVAPIIGESLAHRKKQMFTVPVGEWFRKECYDWLRTTILSNDLVQQLFEPKKVALMLEQHHLGKANFTREIRALAALALWANVALPESCSL